MSGVNFIVLKEETDILLLRQVRSICDESLKVPEISLMNQFAYTLVVGQSL